MAEPARNLAIFDLDYTLTKRGTWGRFVMSAVKSRPHIWLPLAISAGLTQFQYKLGKLPRIRVKQAMMRWAMVGWTQEKVQALAKDFAQKEVEKGLRPGALRALAKHRNAGDRIIIASAAVDVIVTEVAALLDIEFWVATNMAWDKGRLAPHFASDNCYGPEKLARTKVLLAKNGIMKHNGTIITMYSDSYSDLAIMQFADIGIAVNPDKKLQHLAKTHNFQIVDWMK